MRTSWRTWGGMIAVVACWQTASAADYRCVGDAVEKSGSTKYTVRHQGSDYYIEKSGSTKGVAVKRGDRYAVEVSGSTRATIQDGRIEKSGSTWSSVAEAKKEFDCPDVVAATLWVLTRIGQL